LLNEDVGMAMSAMRVPSSSAPPGIEVQSGIFLRIEKEKPRIIKS